MRNASDENLKKFVGRIYLNLSEKYTSSPSKTDFCSEVVELKYSIHPNRLLYHTPIQKDVVLSLSLLFGVSANEDGKIVCDFGLIK